MVSSTLIDILQLNYSVNNLYWLMFQLNAKYSDPFPVWSRCFSTTTSLSHNLSPFPLKDEVIWYTPQV